MQREKNFPLFRDRRDYREFSSPVPWGGGIQRVLRER
jgi:hypothetical protein